MRDKIKEKLIADLKKIAKEGKKRAEKLGIKESDIPKLIHKRRGVKEDNFIYFLKKTHQFAKDKGITPSDIKEVFKRVRNKNN